MIQLYPDGPQASCVRLEKGTHIRLNEEARGWTRDRVFIVEEVKLKGVICSTEASDLPIYVSVASHEPTRARYWAPWAQIAGVVSMTSARI